uniref:Uncharacterized protein n=1 Tax=Anopheles arabiensis TaxID=7173 RepID=A0A182IH85_ANOAR
MMERALACCTLNNESGLFGSAFLLGLISQGFEG